MKNLFVAVIMFFLTVESSYALNLNGSETSLNFSLNNVECCNWINVLDENGTDYPSVWVHLQHNNPVNALDVYIGYPDGSYYEAWFTSDTLQIDEVSNNMNIRLLINDGSLQVYNNDVLLSSYGTPSGTMKGFPSGFFTVGSDVSYGVVYAEGSISPMDGVFVAASPEGVVNNISPVLVGGSLIGLLFVSYAAVKRFL